MGERGGRAQANGGSRTVGIRLKTRELNALVQEDLLQGHFLSTTAPPSLHPDVLLRRC